MSAAERDACLKEAHEIIFQRKCQCPPSLSSDLFRALRITVRDRSAAAALERGMHAETFPRVTESRGSRS